MEKDLTRKNALAIAMTIASSICLTLPFLGGILPIEFRLVVIALFSITSAWLCYYMNGSRNAVSILIVVLIPILFVAESLIRLSFLPSGLSLIFFNLPLMLFLCVLLFLAPKHSILRSYVIISLASYVLEYPLTGVFLSN